MTATPNEGFVFKEWRVLSGGAVMDADGSFIMPANDVSIQAVLFENLFSGGNGTETTPFLIATTDDMDALSSSVNGGTNYSGTHFLMTANLDYSEEEFRLW